MSAAPTTFPTATPTVELTLKASRITPEARDALFLYFANTRWPLNKRLPRGKLGKDMVAIARALLDNTSVSSHILVLVFVTGPGRVR